MKSIGIRVFKKRPIIFAATLLSHTRKKIVISATIYTNLIKYIFINKFSSLFTFYSQLQKIVTSSKKNKNSQKYK